MNDFTRNASGYNDPTAYVAIQNADRIRINVNVSTGNPRRKLDEEDTHEIKPCGFCLSDNVWVGEVYDLRLDDSDEDPFAVHCQQCKARGPIEDTRKRAIMAWNQFGEDD